MTATLPFFRTRDGVFQYERRVPVGIQRNRALFEARFQGRPLFRVSLRSKDRTVALRNYAAADRQFEALIAGASLPSPQREPVRHAPQRIVTDDDLAAIAERYAQITAEPFERLHRQANVCTDAAAELDRMEYELELDAETIRADLRSRDDRGGRVLHPATEATALVAEHGFFAPPGSEYLGAVIGAVRNGLERGYRRVAALAEGEALPMLGSAVAPLKSANTLTLADAVEQYVAARRLPVKSVSEIRLALRQFEQVVGRKSLSATTRHDAHRFAEYLANQTVGGKTAGSIIRHLSEASIRKRLRMLISAVNHVRDAGLYDGENMLAGVRVENLVKATNKALMPDKRRLQVAELNAILAHPWFSGCASPSDIYSPGSYRLTGAEFWVPIVAMFTGCRAAELGGLKVSEVRLDDPYPHFIIRDNEYRRTKSSRTRCVPVLDALIAIGFPTYFYSIRDAGHDRLFPDWTAQKRKGAGERDYPAWSNSGIIRAFNRNVIPATLADRLVPEARREVTFHSLRGAFKAMLGVTNKVPQIIVNKVVGHRNNDLDERYVGEVTIEESYPAVRSASYVGMNLPRAP